MKTKSTPINYVEFKTKTLKKQRHSIPTVLGGFLRITDQPIRRFQKVVWKADLKQLRKILLMGH